jgi:hypothetical protein
MKMRNPVYRGVVRITSGFYRLPVLVRLAIVAAMLASGVGAFVIVPVVLAGGAADPIANIVLRFDRYGRHLLTPKQVTDTDILAMLALAAMFGLVARACGAGGEIVVYAVFAGALVPWARSVRNCRPGRDTRLMTAYVAFLVGSVIVCRILLWRADAAHANPLLVLLAGAFGFAAFLGVVLAAPVARRFGYPWSHHLDAPSR